MSEDREADLYLINKSWGSLSIRKNHDYAPYWRAWKRMWWTLALSQESLGMSREAPKVEKLLFTKAKEWKQSYCAAISLPLDDIGQPNQGVFLFLFLLWQNNLKEATQERRVYVCPASHTAFIIRKLRAMNACTCSVQCLQNIESRFAFPGNCSAYN